MHYQIFWFTAKYKKRLGSSCLTEPVESLRKDWWPLLESFCATHTKMIQIFFFYFLGQRFLWKLFQAKDIPGNGGHWNQYNLHPMVLYYTNRSRNSLRIYRYLRFTVQEKHQSKMFWPGGSNFLTFNGAPFYESLLSHLYIRVLLDQAKNPSRPASCISR